MPGISPSMLLAQAQVVLKRLSKLGVALPPSNRVARAIKIVQASNDGSIDIEAADSETQARILEAFRTLFEAFMIVYTATERPRQVNAFPNDRLRYLLRGADTPAEDSNPQPRNTQFELVVGAVLVLGGADVRPEEPDYLMLYHGDNVGVAAKRLTSLKPEAIRGRIREAARQIRNANTRGFVALNLDSWITDLGRDDPEEVGKNFNQQIWAAHQQLDSMSDREALLGAMIYGYWTRWLFEDATPQLDFRTATQSIAFTKDQEEVERARAFFEPLGERFEHGLRKLVDLLRRDDGGA